MRSVMKMSDLKRELGFPSEIDRTKIVVVQILKNSNIVVLYTDKKGNDEGHFIYGSDIHNIFKTGLYVINPK